MLGWSVRWLERAWFCSSLLLFDAFSLVAGWGELLGFESLLMLGLLSSDRDTSEDVEAPIGIIVDLWVVVVFKEEDVEANTGGQDRLAEQDGECDGRQDLWKYFLQ